MRELCSLAALALIDPDRNLAKLGSERVLLRSLGGVLADEVGAYEILES